VEPAGSFHHLADAPLQEIAGLGAEAARGAAEARRLRNDDEKEKKIVKRFKKKLEENTK
jgi:hypothetical protein